MNNQSFQLIRTNPRLTTHIKIVVASDYNLYLESFNSCSDLSKDKYKHYLLKTDSNIETDFPKFYDGLSKTLAFTPYTFNDVSIMYNKYENQFDEMYFAGADEIEDKWYSEEFEYFAPLYVVKNNIPSNFIIMRVNDPVIYTKKGTDYVIDNLRNDNFKSEIIDKWKCVTVFDMSSNSNIGAFLNRNVNENSRFPDYSFYFDIKSSNFSKFSGMKYEDGVYTSAEVLLNSKLETQNTHYDLEEFITSGFQNNGIVYPFIFNLKFLFNDIPATPEKFLKYSMNRYYGFYTDSLELVKTITSYNIPLLKQNISIKNNIFIDSNGAYTSPFLTLSTDSDWIKYNNNFYQINKQLNGSYKIISNIDFTGVDMSLFNTDVCKIVDNKILLSPTSLSPNIDEYIDSVSNESELMYADLYLIEIDGLYHVLKNDYTKISDGVKFIFTNNYSIHCDYNISSTNDTLEYYKGGKTIDYNDPLNIYNYDRNLINSLDVLSNINTINYYKRDKGIYTSKKIIQSNKPIQYSIYRVNFSDIKDFDYDRVNTSYANFDYEKSTYVETHEEKLNMVEYRDQSSPKKIKLNRYNTDGQYKKMDLSSEYIADGNLYEIKDNTKIKSLNSMWDKTQTINKWGYKDSISHSDYQYKLNNSFDVGGIYNRTVNTDLYTSNLKEKTLDYFYRIGELYGIENIPLIKTIGTSSEKGWEYSYDLSGWETDFNDSILEFSYVTLTDTLKFKLDNDFPKVYLLNNISLEVDKDYFVSYDIDMTSGEIINGNSGFYIGFSDTTFSNQYIDYILDTIITISFIAKSKSSELIFVVDNFKDVIISNFKIHKIENKYYYNQSTNIQTGLLNKYDTEVNDNRFNLNYYIDSKFDYFNYFFNNTMYYEDYGKLYKKQYIKYSVFNGGTSTLPAKTLFNGIEYELYGVTDMVLSDKVGITEKINTIVTSGGNNYNGYKLSVILNENYKYHKFKYGRIDSVELDTTDSIWSHTGPYYIFSGTPENTPEITDENLDAYIDFKIAIDKSKTDIYDKKQEFDITWEITEKEFIYNTFSDQLPTINNSNGKMTISVKENK